MRCDRIGIGSEIVFGFLLIATAGERFTGPLGTNRLLQKCRLEGSLPRISLIRLQACRTVV